MSDGIEERLRRLELGYTKIESQVKTIGGDIKDIKETLKELAEIAKGQVKLDIMFKNFEQEKKTLQQRVEKLENDVQYLKRIAYLAVALGSVGMPIGVELIKHLIMRL